MGVTKEQQPRGTPGTHYKKDGTQAVSLDIGVKLETQRYKEARHSDLESSMGGEGGAGSQV